MTTTLGPAPLKYQTSWGKTFEVTGTLMSGAKSEAVMLLTDKEISSLNEEYVMVIWCCANNINKN